MTSSLTYWAPQSRRDGDHLHMSLHTASPGTSLAFLTAWRPRGHGAFCIAAGLPQCKCSEKRGVEGPVLSKAHQAQSRHSLTSPMSRWLKQPRGWRVTDINHLSPSLSSSDSLEILQPPSSRKQGEQFYIIITSPSSSSLSVLNT